MAVVEVVPETAKHLPRSTMLINSALQIAVKADLDTKTNCRAYDKMPKFEKLAQRECPTRD
jgi:hypothetical protein